MNNEAELLEACAASGQMDSRQVAAHVEAGEMAAIKETNVGEPSELNLWTRQWRDERIRKARADHRERAAAYDCLKDKGSDYALSIRMARDVCAQVLAVWVASPVDLPFPKGEAEEMRSATPLPTYHQQEKK